MVKTLGQDEIIRAMLRQRPRISAGLWLLLKDAHLAEDIFQEVMVKALEGRSLFANEAQLMAWVKITGRNQALNLLKKRSRESCLLDVELWEKVESHLQSGAMATARHEALLDCVEGLPEKSRKLLDLRYYEGRSGDEVARSLRMRPDAVYQALARLHRALHECVKLKLAREAT
jgi:RNA polymerase sigma-70 factor (ECF subfamily)